MSVDGRWLLTVGCWLLLALLPTCFPCYLPTALLATAPQKYDRFDEAADLTGTEAQKQQCTMAGDMIRNLLSLSKVDVGSDMTEVGGLAKTVNDQDGSTQWVRKDAGAAVRSTAGAGVGALKPKEQPKRARAGGGIAQRAP